MKARRNRRGFTIVELVIVIAVIGVLTAILVPTFVNLSNKAREAADGSLIKNMNTALRMAEGEQGRKNDTLSEALDDAYAAGYVVENLTPTADGKDIVWSRTDDTFYYAEKDQKPEQGPSENLYDYFKVYDGVPALSAQTYSVYLKGNSYSSDVEVNVGFDSGENLGIPKVSYVGGDDAKTVVIRTAGDMCEFTVNAPKDDVYHYGYANTSNVVAVANTSYHEHGTSHSLNVTSGNVVIEETGVVFTLATTEGATATVSNNGGNVMESSVASVAGSGSFEIGSLAQLEAFRDASNSGETFEGKTINLNKDVALTRAWKPISNYYRGSNTKEYWFKGTFDGKNHTISGLTNVGLTKSEINSGRNTTTISKDDEFTYGLFASVNDAVIKNIKLTGVNIGNITGLVPDGVGSLVGFYRDCTEKKSGNVTTANIENVSVSGKIVGSDNVGGVWGRATGTYLKVVNVTVASGSVVTADYKASGVGQSLATTSDYDTVANHASVSSVIKDSNQGYNTVAGLSVACGEKNNKKIILSNCSSDGTLSTVNDDSIKSKLFADYSPKTAIEENGTWEFSNRSWSKAQA